MLISRDLDRTSAQTLKIQAKSRRAIVPMVAEMVLIAVTLISSLIFGGFFFGLIGTMDHPAEVAAQVTACKQVGSSETCLIDFTNVGSSNTATAGTCKLGSAEGTLTSVGTITAGETLVGAKCTVPGFSTSSGSRIVGSIPLANGATVYFAGTAS